MDKINQQFLSKVRLIADKAPPELGLGIACVVAAARKVAKGLHIRDKIVPLTEICTHMRNGICVSPNAANGMLDQCASECINVDRSRTAIFDALTNPSAPNQFLIEEVEQAMQTTANSVLALSAIFGYISVVFECVKLLNLWRAIKDARNFVESSSKKRDNISATMNKVSEEINELTVLVKKILAGNSEGDACLDEVVDKIKVIQNKLNDVKMDIRNLEVEIDQTKVCLVDSRRMSQNSVVTNMLTAGATVANVMLLAASASPYLLAVNCALATINLFLAMTNAKAYVISNDDLKKIEQEMKALEELEQQQQEMKRIFDNDMQTLRDFNRKQLK